MVTMAATNENNPPNVQFSLQYPVNQDSSTKGYYKLSMKPEQKQTIYIDLMNTSDVPVTLNIMNTNALSTQNGGINYTDSKGSELSYSLNKSFLANQYIQVQKQIELQANSKQTIPIKIIAPKNNGTYLSGILFTTQQNSEKENDDLVQIKSEVRVGTAIQLDVGNREIPIVDIKESITKVYPSGIQIQTRVENPSPSIIKSYEVHFKVYNLQNQLLFEGGSKQFDMAPFTGIMFPSNWNSSAIQTGKYRIDLTVKGEGKTYTKKNVFEVNKADLKTYKITNATSENKPIVENDNHMMIYSLIGVITALVGYIIFEKRKRRKQAQKEESKN
ncbi:WxL protein peptidoglycan domain-containing protein [Neobacillus vireti]|uniref:WxL protein peptidoglycan domain-containing protein n=1 Tax=Neobacillus vireti TaxID=220686 RepID=UPI00300072D6